jgi:hypothetical protein
MPGQSISTAPNSDDYLLRPCRAGRVYCNSTQAKAWALGFQDPSGRNRLQSPTGSQALAWVAPPKRQPPCRGAREEVLRSDEIIKGIFADKRQSAPFLFSSRWQGLNAFILLHPG